MENSLVSIVTPSYNSEKFITRTIESVLAQTCQDWEMIIVDDGSPDNSNEIIEKFIKQDDRIRLIRLERNSGPAIARNRAIKEAKGRYIAFLDADDLWLPKRLERAINFMNENDLAFTYSSYGLIGEDDSDLGEFIISPEVSYRDLLKTNSIGCLTAIYDAKILGRLYMPDILKRQDYGLWLKILKRIKVAKGIIEPLAVYRVRKNSVSSNKLNAARYQWKIYREVEGLGLFISLCYFVQYTWNGLRKY